MKPGRSTKGPAAGAGRSTSRALTAMMVMAGLVLCYGWNHFFLAPKSAARSAAATQLATAKKSETDLRQSLVQLKKLAADTQAREAELARLGKLVPSDPDVAGAILALNDTANQAQVAWSTFTPATPAASAGGGPVSMAIGMKIAGTFGQVFDYLRRLETLDRLVVVDGIQLASATTNGVVGLEADIKARMFAAGTANPAAATTVGAKSSSSSSGGSSSSAALAKAGS